MNLEKKKNEKTGEKEAQTGERRRDDDMKNTLCKCRRNENLSHKRVKRVRGRGGILLLLFFFFWFCFRYTSFSLFYSINYEYCIVLSMGVYDFSPSSKVAGRSASDGAGNSRERNIKIFSVGVE